MNGLGDPEQWSAMLSPSVFKALKDRIDLDFAPTNAKVFAADEPVQLGLSVKNVKTLIVKVFEINARNFYRDQGREVDTDINLDGLVANEQRNHAYEEPPLRRVRRTFAFPAITKPGVYVIDFIGNGKSSRVLVKKGKLRHLVRTSIAGHIFTVMDEKNRHLKDATLWQAGHEYKADKEGRITVPFSTSPGRHPIILSHGDFATLDHFQHEAESYQLSAGIHIDRESLLPRKKATVFIRPQLTVNGTPVTLAVLEDVRLILTSTDRDGTASTKEVKDFKLTSDAEATYEFKVPERLMQLSVSLQARVPNISGNRKDVVVDAESFTLNTINRSAGIEDLYLTKSGGAKDATFKVDLLGLSGEPLADRPIHVRLKHRLFTDPVDAQLKTNDFGRVELGQLHEVDWVEARSPQGASHRWSLPRADRTFHQVLHVREGESLQVPYLHSREAGDVSLLERRGTTFVADRSNALAVLVKGQVTNGMLNFEGLKAGMYDLLLKPSNTRIQIRVNPGEVRDGYVLGDTQHLEVRDPSPLQIGRTSIAVNKQVEVNLVNASKEARLHVIATRYVPAYSAFSAMSRVRDPEPYLISTPVAESRYLAGRNIGDEYRYIIDRQYAKKFPGNTLKRPSLILNPWAVRTTSTGSQNAADGDEFAASGADRGGVSTRGKGRRQDDASPTDSSTLDFLPDGSVVLLNLRPDKENKVLIPWEKLGGHGHLQFIAVDSQQTVYETTSLREEVVKFEDLRLVRALDTKQHYTQQKRTSVVAAKKKFVLDDITSSRFELYDSLAKVYGLYATLSGDAKLAEFGFVLGWPSLKDEEKRAKYSQFASHELNFFLFKKDPKFFADVIRPYLKNKQHKTFMDHWLLGEDVSRFRRPWEYARLNTVEKILLGQRLKGEGSATERLISDQMVMVPPNLERIQLLFNTALGSSALDTDDGLGFEEALQDAVEFKKSKKKSNVLRLPGGFGGGMGGAGPPAARAAAAAPTEAIQSPPRPGEPQSDKLAKLADYAKDAKKRAPAKRADRAAGRESGGRYSNRDFDRRKAARRLYEKLDKTREWAENNYYHVLIANQNANLVKVNAFWNDYAAANPKQPFYSTNLAEAAGNLTEMMFALSVLDLPFKAGEHKSDFDKSRMELEVGSPVVIFHEEIREAAAAKGAATILVSQNYFKHGDRTRVVNGQSVDKYVTEEFITHTVYGCQVVVTNPTSARQKLNVLVQIPLGAVPVMNAKYTRSTPLNLDPYATSKIEYHFYFPATGDFPHYPVHVAANEKLIANAAATSMKVVDTPTKIDRGSWDYVSQQGTDDEVLAFLSEQNLQPINLARIAFRMQDAKFFARAIVVLDRRHAYNSTLWSYAVKHQMAALSREYLKHSDRFIAQCGAYLDSPLLTIDPVERRSYEHLDYSPIVNARAHRLGGRRQILNDRLFQQYSRLLRILSYRDRLDSEDRLAVTYYLLLQDRVDEALEMFGQADAKQLATLLQYDYFAAYLDLYSADPKRARSIVAKYEKFPVDRWRQAFADVANQLKEIQGEAVAFAPKQVGVQVASINPRDAVLALNDNRSTGLPARPASTTFVGTGQKTRPTAVADNKLEDRNDAQEKLANTEPNFEFKVESKRVRLDYQNLNSVRVNYYEMDIELLFSRNPFVQQFSGEFSYIRPNVTETVKLPAGKKSHEFDLPKKFHSSNVLIEITGAGQTKTQTYYSHSLNIQVVENYGQVRVTHRETKRSLSKTYVKVYAQMANGQVRFYKDGYTDLRGRFDYTSLNTNELDNVHRFSILILSDDHGALIKEAAPPKR